MTAFKSFKTVTLKGVWRLTREHLSRGGRIFRCGLAAVVRWFFFLAAGCSRSAVEPGKGGGGETITKGSADDHYGLLRQNRYQGHIYTSQIWSVEGTRRAERGISRTG